MKKLLILVPLVFLSACTCINYQTPDVTASYCSTKDIEGINFKYGDITLRVDRADNEVGEALGSIAKGAVEGITGGAPSAADALRKKVLERLTE